MRRTISFYSLAALLLLTGFASGDSGFAQKPETFIQARAGYRFSFPRDHRPHHGYRTEWWYYTGTLKAEDGRRFGFQFTIFKVERKPNPRGSHLGDGVFFMAHMALSDPDAGRFYFTERIQRFFPGMAGMDGDTLYVRENRLKIAGNRHVIQARADDFRLELDVTSRLGPLIHGRNGLSAKGFNPRVGSHYFSVVDLLGSARLKIKGREIKIAAAKAWMDHEFGSNVLLPDQTGWDWLHITLENGERFMLFRVRSDKGRNFYSGSRISPTGAIRYLRPGEIAMKPVRWWTTPDKRGRYPIAWDVRIGEYELEVRPWLDGQELRPPFSRVRYWEGAMDAKARVGGREIKGTGFLEMTGYAGSMAGRL